MEYILQYLWQHKIFPVRPLTTTEGKNLEVLNPGLLNRDAGPDFIGAKIKIDGVVWVGNVEVHVKSSDWYYHHHDTNPDYDSVVLHVAKDVDREVTSSEGRHIPQMQLPVPEYVLDNYNDLLTTHADPRCRNVISSIPSIAIHNFMSSLEIERLEYRDSQIAERLRIYNNDWESVAMSTIMRSIGFGINSDAFETLSHNLPMQSLSKHRDDLFQIEAMFFGQAGLLNDERISKANQCNILNDKYYQDLKREYAYLSHKFSLTPIKSSLWRFLRLRPQNFPHIRIAQLAMMYHQRKVCLASLIGAQEIAEIYDLLDVNVSQYWKSHYSFASPASREVDKSVSVKSKDLIIINGVIPLMFSYGKYKNDEPLCEKALNLLEQLKPEDNRYIREWRDAGIECSSAADSQALIHLTRNYCQNRDCLRCRFGYEFIRQNPDFLREKPQST